MPLSRLFSETISFAISITVRHGRSKHFGRPRKTKHPALLLCLRANRHPFPSRWRQRLSNMRRLSMYGTRSGGNGDAGSKHAGASLFRIGDGFERGSEIRMLDRFGPSADTHGHATTTTLKRLSRTIRSRITSSFVRICQRAFKPRRSCTPLERVRRVDCRVGPTPWFSP